MTLQKPYILNKLDTIDSQLVEIKTYLTPQMFYQVSDGTNWSLAIQRAIDYSKNLLLTNGLGNQQIIEFPSGTYTLNTQIIVPNFIRLKAIGNVIFISNVTGDSTFRLYGNPSDGVTSKLTSDKTFHSLFKGSWFNGIDGGFTLKLANGVSQTGTIGIEIGSRVDVNNAEYFTGWWSVNDITIVGFETGLYFNKYDMFLGNLDRLLITRCTKAVSFNGNGTVSASNSGEGIRFNNCIFGNNGDCILVNMSDLELVFNGCSFDFIERAIVTNTMCVIRVSDCHFEGIGYADSGSEIGGDTASIVYSTGGYWNAPTIVVKGSDFMKLRTIPFRATASNGMSLSIDSLTTKGSTGFNKLYAVADDNVDILNNNFIPSIYLNMITQRKLNQKIDPNFDSQTVGTTITNSSTITGYTFANNIQTASAVISNEYYYGTSGKSLKLSVPVGGIWTTIKSEDFTCKIGDKIINNLFWYIKDTASANTGRIKAKVTFYDKNSVALTYPTTALDEGTISLKSTNNEWNRLSQMEQVIAPPNAVKFNVTYTINPTVQCTLYLGEFYTTIY